MNRTDLLRLHDSTCTCGRCRFTHQSVTFRLNVTMHEGATVASACGQIQGKADLIRQTVKRELQRLADQASSTDGIVGHIKSAVEFCQTEGYSITLDTVQEVISDIAQAEITVDAIVFGISTDLLEELLKKALMSIAEIHCSFDENMLK